MSADAARRKSMQLLAQDFGAILAALRAAEDATGHERRTSNRMDVQAQAKVIPFTNGRAAEPFTCMTRDLCFKGIGLLQSKPSTCGSQFVITLPKPDGESMSILCTVMYCRALADGIYNVGASFNRPYDLSAAPPVELRGGAGGAQAQTAAPANADELVRIRQSILG